jgi:PhnB protein
VAQLNPYIFFGGNCREAMTFYQACLGGELHIQTVGESPAASQMPPETHNGVMHSALQGGGLTLMGSDMIDGSAVNVGNAVTLCINVGTRDETRDYYEKLAAGGTITAPLQEEFFGMFGSLTDKFGINWMFQAT